MKERLKQASQELGLDISDEQIGLLLRYLELLKNWNKTYNLTAIDDAGQMLTHHIIDSLALIGFLKRYCPQSLLDVGSGAGLPGAVVAICAPEINVSCVDKVGKKTAFINYAAGALKLKNLKAINSRVELIRNQKFDAITSRAFASLELFTKLSGDLLAENGKWLAMKGLEPTDEITQLSAGVIVREIVPINVPYLDAARHVIIMEKAV